MNEYKMKQATERVGSTKIASRATQNHSLTSNEPHKFDSISKLKSSLSILIYNLTIAFYI